MGIFSRSGWVLATVVGVFAVVRHIFRAIVSYYSFGSGLVSGNSYSKLSDAESRHQQVILISSIIITYEHLNFHVALFVSWCEAEADGGGWFVTAPILVELCKFFHTHPIYFWATLKAEVLVKSSNASK